MRILVRHVLAAALTVGAVALSSQLLAAPAKDQSRIEGMAREPGKILPNLDAPRTLPIPVPQGGASPDQLPTMAEP